METADRLDRWIPWLMVAMVMAVATFAFTQSYTHVFYLGQTHHQTGASLRMLPLSVDWLMFASGLVMLHLGRKGLKHWLPRAALAAGATATLIANIAAGIIWGWQTAAINAWAPVVLFIVVELGMLLVRTAKAKPEAKPIQLTELRSSQPAPEPSQPTQAMPKAVDGPDSLQGWGQLAGREPADRLTGIGLRNGAHRKP